MKTLLTLCCWAGLILLPRIEGADRNPMKICEAVEHRAASEIVVAGLAQSTQEGLIMGDLSCPVFRLKGIRIPAAIVVTPRSFGTDEIKRQFSSIKPSLDSPRMRVVVRGIIECKNSLRFNVSDDRRDITGGDGYGVHGFYKCSISDGRLEVLEPPKER
jgi:hypothetical protein